MEYKAPQNISKVKTNSSRVFLAGSIENGAAEPWQHEMSKYFQNFGLDILNPRRDSWNSSLEQKYDNPEFYQQVNWELNALEKTDIILMYFDPRTKSPISLLELGLYARSKKIFVVCPDGFYRKGNVEIVCDRYNIPIFDNIDAFKFFFETIVEQLILDIKKL